MDHGWIGARFNEIENAIARMESAIVRIERAVNDGEYPPKPKKELVTIWRNDAGKLLVLRSGGVLESWVNKLPVKVGECWIDI